MGTRPPAGTAGRLRGRTSKQSASARGESRELSWERTGRDQGQAIFASAARSRAYSVRARRWPRAQRRCGPVSGCSVARAACPSRARSRGTRKRRAQTSAETGLPGRPRMRVCLSRPNISGLPGRMAIFQNDSAIPRAVEHGRDQIVIADRGAADGDQHVGVARLCEMRGKAFAAGRGRCRGTRPRRRPLPPSPRRPDDWRRRSGPARASARARPVRLRWRARRRRGRRRTLTCAIAHGGGQRHLARPKAPAGRRATAHRR